MKINSIITTFWVLIFLQNPLSAQDIHSSLNPVSPQLNPAWTGILRGAAASRFQAFHRKQWSTVMGDAAYTTTHASFDHNFFQGKYNFVGLGIHLSHDQAGKMPLRQTQADVSGSVIMRLSELQRHKSMLYFSGGIQVSFAQRRFDAEGITWSEQFNGSNGYNLTLPSGEPLSSNGAMLPNRSYGDAAMGIALNYVNTNKDKVLEWAQFGGSIHHLVGALGSSISNVSQYQDSVFLLRHRYAVHTGALFGLGRYDRLGIAPMAFFTVQNKIWQAQAGTYFQWRLGNYLHFKTPNTLQIGAFSRLTGAENTPLSMESLILASRVDWNNWSFMVSYDVNLSKLRPASFGQGGFEFGLIVQIGSSTSGKLGVSSGGSGKNKRQRVVICP